MTRRDRRSPDLPHVDRAAEAIDAHHEGSNHDADGLGRVVPLEATEPHQTCGASALERQERRPDKGALHLPIKMQRQRVLFIVAAPA
jgi:hypothetical protein